MTERVISISYGVAAGAGLVALGISPLVVAPIGMVVGVILELYRGHQQKAAEVDDE